MKHSILIIFILTQTVVSFAQARQTDSIAYYISKLNWESITVSSTYVPKLYYDDNVHALIRLKNKTIDTALFKKLSDTAKILAIHTILTDRFHIISGLSLLAHREHDDSVTMYQPEHYIKDSLLGLSYTYNGLEWYYDLNTHQSSLTGNAVTGIQEYWRKKLFRKKGRKNTQ